LEFLIFECGIRAALTPVAMQATMATNTQSPALKVGVGFGGQTDPRRASIEAAEIARAGLNGGTPQLALIITAGDAATDPVPMVRSVLGPIGIAGGVTTGVFTEAGIASRGVLVVAFATEGDAASGAACVGARDLADAGRSAARLVMAGWPFRLRYPRGLGLTFTSTGSPLPFLESWRQFMGPKMRTVCGVMPGPMMCGTATHGAVASVACLEASYATGLGYADGFAPEARPDANALVHGTAEATTTALKRLDERLVRLVVMFESAARYEALGALARDEWAGVLSEVGDRAPCVGWLCDRVAGYGRGLQPVDHHGALIVAAMGDAPAVSG